MRISIVPCATAVAATALVLFSSCPANGFLSSTTQQVGRSCYPSRTIVSSLRMEEDTTSAAISTPMTEEEELAQKNVDIRTSTLYSPLSFDEMVRQSSSAMSDAYEQGVRRQIVRVLLPRDPSGYQLGRYFEDKASFSTRELMLVPPDESWQGGIMQIYRAVSPTCIEILKRFSRNNNAGLPPKMIEDRSVDSSGVDGASLWMTQNTDPKNDVSCFILPTQETVDAVEAVAKKAGDRLVALLNPQWRDTDDALDKASRSNSFFGNLATMLGGKGESLRRLNEMGFQTVYSLEGYVCKGGNIRLIKRFDSDWVIFAENDAATGYIKVGTSKTRPTYQDVDRKLSEMGVSLKYARDLGLAPKL